MLFGTWYVYVAQQEPEGVLHARNFLSPAAKNVARPKTRVELRATRVPAPVAQTRISEPNIAPAQQRKS